FLAILTALRFRRYSFEGPYPNIFTALVTIGSAGMVLVSVGCTAMIVLMIWWVGRDASSARARSTYKKVILALVESGGMYTVVLLAVAPLIVIPEQFGTSSFIIYIYTMVTSVAPMLIIFLLHKPAAESSPGSALGEGVEPSQRIIGAPFASSTPSPALPSKPDILVPPLNKPEDEGI
ncbi:hypothetical protein FRB97_007566, partial [Tulasnella sp. 331]